MGDKYGFSEIVELPDLSVAEINTGTRNFLIREHSDPDFIIDIETELLDNGSFPVSFTLKGIPAITYTVLYNFKSEIKEGRTRISITNFKLSTNAAGTTSEVPMENFIETSRSVKGMGKKGNETMILQIIEGVTEKSENLIEKYRASFLAQKSDW